MAVPIASASTSNALENLPEINDCKNSSIEPKSIPKIITSITELRLTS